jgi:hypothetical protein
MKTFSAFFCLILTAILSTAQVASAQYVCQHAPQPVMIQGSINIGDVQQAGRITRDGRPSSCSGDTAAIENNTALRRDTHNFVNPFNEQVCVRVEVDFTGCGGNQTQSVAYSNFNPANPAAGVIGDMGYSTIGKGSYSFSVGPNAAFTIGVNEVEAGTGCPLYKLKVTYLRNCRQPGFDRTNDGKADLTVYRPSAVSKWWTIDSATSEITIRDFGTVGDLVTGGSDYTGDGQTDLSVYRPSENTWYYGTSQDAPGTNFAAQPWGVSGDRAVPGDFDGDGLNDIAIWRPSEGNFYVLRSGDGTFQQFKWGVSTDTVVTGDFDGDTVTDFVVVRPTLNGSFWWIQKSNYNYGFDQVIQWGLPTDKLVPADYDGDSITDLAVWRPSEGNFYVRRSSDFQMQVARFGSTGDIPQPADYDGDRKADFALWRPSTGVWYIINSETDTFKIFKWGQQGDQPITAAYRIQ